MSEPRPQAPKIAVAPIVIPYESPAPSGRRPWWIYVIVGIYLLLVGGLIAMPLILSQGADAELGVTSGVVVLVMILCGLALIVTPIKVGRRRPVTRRTILVPIIASGLLLGGLVLGGGIALAELLSETINPSDAAGWTVLAAALGVWIGWSVVFVILSRGRDPQTLGMKLHRYLIVGSALELLVAVSAHLVVRQRSECCAGMLTGTGICIGIAIGLVSFGPSVLLLFGKRCRQIAVPVARANAQ